MLQTARFVALRATTEPFNWGLADSSGTSLPAGGNDTSGRADIKTFAARDYRLAFRDQIVAAAIMELALSVANTWGIRLERPDMVFKPALAAPATSQSGSINVAGQVTFVNNGDVIAALSNVDIALYNRDLVLYNALEQIAENILNSSTLIPDSGLDLDIGDAWSLAQEVLEAAGLSESLPLRRDDMSAPDQCLAYRDNTMAAYVSRIAGLLDNIFSLADRLLVQFTPSDGPEYWEIMNIISEDDSTRVWAANISSGLQLVYVLTTQQIYWRNVLEGNKTNPQASPSGPQYAFSGYASGVLANILPQVPPFRPASWFLAQANKPEIEDRLEIGKLVVSTDNPITWRVSSPATFADPDLIRWTNGTLNFAIPGDLQAGAYKISVLYQAT